MIAFFESTRVLFGFWGLGTAPSAAGEAAHPQALSTQRLTSAVPSNPPRSPEQRYSPTSVPTLVPLATRRMLPGIILNTRMGMPFSRHRVTAVESITPRCAARNLS